MGSRALCLLPYLSLLALWAVCLVGAQGNEFCKGGLSADGLRCSGGCKFGSGTITGAQACSNDTLVAGLEKCKFSHWWKGLARQNYSQIMTCTECEPGFSGTFCTQENIAYKPFRKRQDGNFTTRGKWNVTKQLSLTSRRRGAAVIDFYPKGDNSRNQLPNCSIEGCEWASRAPDMALRMTCRTAPKKKGMGLWIRCPNNQRKIKLSEVQVYVCAPFWSGLETGCNEPCNCQDGVDCNPFTGACPSGKEILPSTTTSSIGPVTSSDLRSPSPAPATSPPTHTTPSETPVVSPSTFEPTHVTQVSTVTTSEPLDFTEMTSDDANLTVPDSTDVVTQTSVMTTQEEDIDASTAAPTRTSTEKVTSPYTAAPTSTKSGMSPKTHPPPTMEPTPTTAWAGDEDERKKEAGYGNQLTNQGTNLRGSGGMEGEGWDRMVAVWGAVGAMVVLVAVAVLAAIVYKKKYGQSGKKEAQEDTPCVVDMEMNDRTPTPPLKDDEDVNEYANTAVATEPISVDAFGNHLCYMKRVGGYSREYQELPSGILSPVTAAEEVNMGDVKKNRFRDISPYDESRVVLKKEKESDSDYINASYIDGFAEAMAYICAQGPLPETVGDFWHMVWTEGCSKIIMLTNLVEGAKVKCERYWPENEGSSQTFGAYTVTNVKVVQKAHFVLRRMSIAKQADEGSAAEASREVQQFHFTAWPDHGVPCPVALVRFWSSVVLHPVRLGGPLLVHCSAGIGRTGTFVALDMLTHQTETTGKVSVFPTVRRLRKQRVNMVQTLSQYKFLHEVLQEWLSCRQGDMVRDDLLHSSRWKAEEGAPPTTLPPAIKQQCAAQFKLLAELRPEVSDDDDGSTARREENAAKNRFPHILPADQFRVCLAKSHDEDNDYINAVFLPSLTRQQGYAVTQLPLANTVSDFWCMVRDWRVKTVVRFMDAPRDQEMCLFPDQGQKVQHGEISVHTTSKATVTPGLSLYTLHLNGQETQSAGSVGQEVCVYCVESQQALSLKATKVLVTLANILLPLATAANQPPVVLQCFDGAGLSCMLCAVMMGVEALQEEERTNPFLLARLVHTARPQAFVTPEEYEFMVRCLLHHAQGITEEGDTDTATDSQQGSQGNPVSTDAEPHIYGNVNPVSTDAELHIYGNV